MLNRLKKLKKLWTLSRKSRAFHEYLENSTDKQLDELPNEDTKAVFMRDGTEEEYKEYVRQEVNGWKHFDKMINDILNRHER